MAVYFKNSYKSDGAVLPLSVKNVGFQQCTPGYRWGAGVRDHYLIHYVVSGRGTFTAAEARRAGVSHFVSKPFVIEEFVDLARALLPLQMRSAAG